jgi:hypothetical protein
MEFSPTIDVHMLAQDINPVRLRFKKPNELLLHQIAHLITGDDVKDLQHVDSTVGGNRGKGQLCMIFNMMQESLSRLFQFTRVESSKADI